MNGQGHMPANACAACGDPVRPGPFCDACRVEIPKKALAEVDRTAKAMGRRPTLQTIADHGRAVSEAAAHVQGAGR